MYSCDEIKPADNVCSVRFCPHILGESLQRLPSADPLTSGSMSQRSAGTNNRCQQRCMIILIDMRMHVRVGPALLSYVVLHTEYGALFGGLAFKGSTQHPLPGTRPENHRHESYFFWTFLYSDTRLYLVQHSCPQRHIWPLSCQVSDAGSSPFISHVACVWA